MYLPAHFAQTDPAALHALMRQYPLATLVTEANGEPVADEVPFLFSPVPGPHGTLKAHVARANPVWQNHPLARQVLVVFRGPQAYVSPSWYPGKAEHHKVVPTWNYAVVHAHGTLRAVDDAPWLRTLVARLTERHEAGRAAPWAVDDAPADYVAQMLRAIVGIEIAVTRLQGKWKTSQNRSAADRAGAAAGLVEHPMAALVRP